MIDAESVIAEGETSRRLFKVTWGARTSDISEPVI
jgi:hypothetical protein